MLTVKQSLSRRGLTPNLLVERIEAGEKLTDILEEFGTSYGLIARWRKNNAWFAEHYPEAMRKGHPTAISQGQFDACFPGWKTVFIAALQEMVKPTISGALAALNERSYPVTTSRLYAAKTPGTKWYDEEFALLVETHGDAEKVNTIKELLEEQLETKMGEGKDLNVGLSYLRTHRLSPLRDRSEVNVTTKTTKELVVRTEVRATLAVESQAIAERIKGALHDAKTTDNEPLAIACSDEIIDAEVVEEVFGEEGHNEESAEAVLAS